MADKLTPEQLAQALNDLSPQLLETARIIATMAKAQFPAGSSQDITKIMGRQVNSALRGEQDFFRTEVIAAIEGKTPVTPGTITPPPKEIGDLVGSLGGKAAVDGLMGDILARSGDKAPLGHFQKVLGDTVAQSLINNLQGVDADKLVLPAPVPAPTAPPAVPQK